MSTVLAIPCLYEDVVASMAAEAAAADPPVDPVVHAFGWRERAKRKGRRRIVWTPGDDGDVGRIGPARNPGRNPRPLATLHELVTIDLEAVDDSDAEDQLLQYTAARLLFDDWYRHVRSAAYGRFEIESLSWVDDRNTRRRGATIRVVMSVQAMVPDAPADAAPVDTDALVTSHPTPTDDDEGETDTVSAA